MTDRRASPRSEAYNGAASSNHIFVSQHTCKQIKATRSRHECLHFPHRNLLFCCVAVCQSSTAARTWNAVTPCPPSSSPPSSFGGTTSFTSSHHKVRSSFSPAKSRPSIWEDAAQDGEAKVERELASWQTGWTSERRHQKGRSRTAAYNTDNPYTRSGSTLPSVTRRGDRWSDSIDNLPDSFYLRGHPSHRSGGSSGGGGASSNATTMTEDWSDYSSLLVRVHELAGQVEHMYGINIQLEDAAKAQTRELQDLQQQHQQLQKTIEQERQNHVASLNTIRDDNEEDTTEALRAEITSQNTRLQSQDHLLDQLQADLASIRTAREVDAVEIARIPSLEATINELQTAAINAAEAATAAEASRMEVETAARLQLEEDNRIRYEQQLTDHETAFKLRMDELDARQQALEAQERAAAATQQEQATLQQQQRVRMEERIEELQHTVNTQLEELTKMRELEATILSAKPPPQLEQQAQSSGAPPENQPSEIDLQARNIATLESQNHELTQSLLEKDRQIHSLLTSSEYRRNLQKERAMESAVAVPENKKSTACSIM